MITVLSNKESIRYSAYHLIKAFLPEEEILQQEGPDSLVVIKDGEEVLHCNGLQNDRDETTAESFGKCAGGQTQPGGKAEIDGEVREDAAKEKHQTELLIYDTFSKLTGKKLPWGVLTGVRPIKLASEKLDKMDKEAFINYFEETRRVSSGKAETAWDIAAKERTIIRSALAGKDKDYNSYSMYVGIPICPSICSYCSFSSGLLSKWAGSMDAYVDCLIKEVKSTAGFMDGKSLTSIYIGGGTPTVLTESQLGRLLEGICKYMPADKIKEFTLEAGRPDTINKEKLQIALKNGISRISINPQTMQQKTLDLIGRKHTVEQIISSFDLAREIGFDNINMDIIAGLQGEDLADFEDTLEKISRIKPDSLTVHALAIKRASRESRQSTAGDIVTDMILAAGKTAGQIGMSPYYLYRQKSIAGNHENTGYAFAGKEGIYNIMIMEEVQTIMACGAGATSKYLLESAVQNPDRAKGVMTDLLRFDNLKSIADYIENIDKSIAAKEKLFDIKGGAC